MQLSEIKFDTKKEVILKKLYIKTVILKLIENLVTELNFHKECDKIVKRHQKRSEN